MNNLGLRLVSIGLAAVLWLAMAAEKTSEMGVIVPLELQNLPRDLELTGEAVSSIEVRLRASPSVIQRLTQGDVAAQVDLKGVHEGERIVHLTEQAIRAPFGVRVVKISPSILTLRLERTLQKTVPVRPRHVGQPARGYELGELLSDPQEVRIVGPKSRVQEIESAFTEAVVVEGAQTDVVDSVNLGLEDPLLRILDRTRVRVVAKVREAHEERSFEGLPISARGGGAVLRPDTASVVLSGPAPLLTRMAKADVRPYVEVSRLDSTRRLSVTVELASGYASVSVRRTDPKEVLAIPTSKASR